jgi:hypothetical protein
VANMGATHHGCAIFRSLALISAGSPSSNLRSVMAPQPSIHRKTAMALTDLVVLL